MLNCDVIFKQTDVVFVKVT